LEKQEWVIPPFSPPLFEQEQSVVPQAFVTSCSSRHALSMGLAPQMGKILRKSHLLCLHVTGSDGLGL